MAAERDINLRVVEDSRQRVKHQQFKLSNHVRRDISIVSLTGQNKNQTPTVSKSMVLHTLQVNVKGVVKGGY